jgi:peptide/nickel transport system ATP-binding protein
LLLRLIKPTRGNLIYKGRKIGSESEGHLKVFRRRVQGIFQDPAASVDPFMNVYQIMEEPLIIHRLGSGKERNEMVNQALQEVKLTPPVDFLPKYSHTLSGGQRQRLAIGRALILRPDIIVADEPVSMIDASSRAEILYLFKELRDKHGISFLYITHDIATAGYFCQRIAVMYLGKIVELGSAREVVKNPFHPYTKALIQAVPSPDPSNRFQERPVIPGEPPSPMNVPNGCSFHPRCPDFMPGRCDDKPPQVKDVSPNHTTACYLY